EESICLLCVLCVLCDSVVNLLNYPTRSLGPRADAFMSESSITSSPYKYVGGPSSIGRITGVNGIVGRVVSGSGVGAISSTTAVDRGGNNRTGSSSVGSVPASASGSSPNRVTASTAASASTCPCSASSASENAACAT